jgi:capsular polysaccharide biosynthesis protein
MMQAARSAPPRPEVGASADDEGLRQPNIPLLVILTVLTLVAANGAALAISMTSKRIWGARVEIVFQPASDLGEAAADRQLFTQEVILRSRAVLDPVAKATRTPVTDVEKSLAIDILNQTNVIRVTVSSPDKETARVLAQRIADTYSQEVSSAGTSEYSSSVSQLQRRISQLSFGLAADQNRLAQLRADPAVTVAERDLAARVTSVQQLLAKLQDQLAGLEMRRFRLPAAEVLTRAYVLPTPLQPKPLQALAVGSLVGLFVATVIAIVLLWRGFRGTGQWD